MEKKGQTTAVSGMTEWLIVVISVWCIFVCNKLRVMTTCRVEFDLTTGYSGAGLRMTGRHSYSTIHTFHRLAQFIGSHVHDCGLPIKGHSTLEF